MARKTTITPEQLETQAGTPFCHKPKGLSGTIHPVFTKALFVAVFDAARTQPWWDDKTIGYVGDKDGFAYFQMKGVTTGFARLRVEGL